MKRALFALAALAPLVACANPQDGRPGNPPSTATQRAYDRATDSPATSADGTGNNPSGTGATRALDRAAGTAAERAYDRATGSNTSGAYPSNSGGTRQR